MSLGHLGRGLVLALVVVTLGVAIGGIWVFFKRPLALQAWMGRQGLKKAGLSRHTLDGSAGRLVFWKGGKGPVLVLLHGAGDQASTWSGVAGTLSKSHTLLIPDLSGHGGSAPASGPLRLATVLTGLEELLDREAPSSRVTLLGNSMGAWIACLYVERHVERVERLVLVNGGPLAGDGAYNLMPKDRAEARRLLEALRSPESLRVPDFVLDDIIRAASHGPIARLVQGGDLGPNLMNEARLSRIVAPVELLWGEADRVVPTAYAMKMAAALPNARLTLVPQCGHIPQLECPVRFASLLDGLLRSAPPQGPAKSAR